jgi:hypothetical protein
MPADPAYLALLAQAKRDGARITRERMIALRRAWMASSDFNPVMPTILAQRVRPRAGDDCARAKAAADAILAIYWLDLRSHAVKLACARRERDTASAALHAAVRDAIMEAVRATGPGSAPEQAASVISVDEQYAVFEILGWRPTRVRFLEVQGGRYDLHEAVRQRDGGAVFMWFDVAPLFAFYERRGLAWDGAALHPAAGWGYARVDAGGRAR